MRSLCPIDGTKVFQMFAVRMLRSCLRLAIFIDPSRLVSGRSGDRFPWMSTLLTIYPILIKARKFTHLLAQWVNVPRHVVEDLIRQSQGTVLSNLDGLTISKAQYPCLVHAFKRCLRF